MSTDEQQPRKKAKVIYAHLDPQYQPQQQQQQQSPQLPQFTPSPSSLPSSQQSHPLITPVALQLAPTDANNKPNKRRKRGTSGMGAAAVFNSANYSSNKNSSPNLQVPPANSFFASATSDPNKNVIFTPNLSDQALPTPKKSPLFASSSEQQQQQQQQHLFTNSFQAQQLLMNNSISGFAGMFGDSKSLNSHQFAAASAAAAVADNASLLSSPSALQGLTMKSGAAGHGSGDASSYRYQAALAALSQHAGTTEQRLSAPERRNPALSAMSIRWLKKQAIADQEAREQQAARNALLAAQNAHSAKARAQLLKQGQHDFASGPISMTLTNVTKGTTASMNATANTNQTNELFTEKTPPEQQQQQQNNQGQQSSSLSNEFTRSEVVPGYCLEIAKATQDQPITNEEFPSSSSATTSPHPKTITSRYLGGVTGAYNQAVRRKLLLARFSEVVVFLGHQAKARLQSQQDKLEFIMLDSAATRDSRKSNLETFQMLQDQRRRRIKKWKKQEKLKDKQQLRKKKKKMQARQQMTKDGRIIPNNTNDSDENESDDSTDDSSGDDDDDDEDCVPLTPRTVALRNKKKKEKEEKENQNKVGSAVANSSNSTSAATNNKPRRAVVSFGVDANEEKKKKLQEENDEDENNNEKVKNVKDWFDSPITPVMNEIMETEEEENNNNSKNGKRKKKSAKLSAAPTSPNVSNPLYDLKNGGVENANQLQEMLISYYDCLDEVDEDDDDDEEDDTDFDDEDLMDDNASDVFEDNDGDVAPFGRTPPRKEEVSSTTDSKTPTPRSLSLQRRRSTAAATNDGGGSNQKTHHQQRQNSDVVSRLRRRKSTTNAIAKTLQEQQQRAHQQQQHKLPPGVVAGFTTSSEDPLSNYFANNNNDDDALLHTPNANSNANQHFGQGFGLLSKNAAINKTLSKEELDALLAAKQEGADDNDDELRREQKWYEAKMKRFGFNTNNDNDDNEPSSYDHVPAPLHRQETQRVEETSSSGVFSSLANHGQQSSAFHEYRKHKLSASQNQQQPEYEPGSADEALAILAAEKKRMLNAKKNNLPATNNNNNNNATPPSSSSAEPLENLMVDDYRFQQQAQTRRKSSGAFKHLTSISSSNLESGRGGSNININNNNNSNRRQSVPSLPLTSRGVSAESSSLQNLTHHHNNNYNRRRSSLPTAMTTLLIRKIANFDMLPSELSKKQRRRILKVMTPVEREHFNRHRVIEALQTQIEDLDKHCYTLNELREELKDHRGVLSDRFVSRMMQISQIVAGANWAAVAKTSYCTPVDPWSAFEGLLSPELLNMLLDTTALVPSSSQIAQSNKDNDINNSAAGGNNSNSSKMKTLRSLSLATTGSSNNNQTTTGTTNSNSATDSNAGGQQLENNLVNTARSGATSLGGEPTKREPSSSTIATTIATTTNNANTNNKDEQNAPVGVAKIHFDFDKPNAMSSVNFKRMLDERLRDCVNFAHQDGLLTELGVFYDASVFGTNVNNTNKQRSASSPPPTAADNDENKNNNNNNSASSNNNTRLSAALQKQHELDRKRDYARAGALRLERALQAHGLDGINASGFGSVDSTNEQEIKKAIDEASEKSRMLRPIPANAISSTQNSNNSNPNGDGNTNNNNGDDNGDGKKKMSINTMTEQFFEQMSKFDSTVAALNKSETLNTLDFTALFDFDGTRQELAQQHLKLTQKQEEAQKKSTWSDAPLHDQVALWFAVLKRIAPRLCISALAPGLFDEGTNMYDNPKNQYRLGMDPAAIEEAARSPDGRLPPYIYFATTDGDIVGVPSTFVLNPDGEEFHPAKIRAAILAERKRRQDLKKKEEEDKKKRLQEEEKQLYEELLYERKKKELAKKKKQKQQGGNIPSWLQKEKQGGGDKSPREKSLSPSSGGNNAKNNNSNTDPSIKDGFLPDGRRASLVEQARKIMQERHSSMINNNSNNQGSNTNANNNSSNLPSGDTNPTNNANNNSNNKLNANSRKYNAPTIKSATSSSTIRGSSSSAAANKKRKKTAIQNLHSDENDPMDQFGGGSSSKPKRGLVAALAAAYQNIEKMAKEATVPTADPTRRRDTLTELFPKIRMFTGHDGFAVRTLKATRSVTLGSVLISCGEDKVLRISRTYSQELLVVVPGSFAVASGLHLEFYTDRLLSTHLDGTLRMWDVTVEPPKSTILLSATMQSSQERIRMNDIGQLFHETFHGQYNRNKYGSGGGAAGSTGEGAQMLGGGRSKRGSLILQSVGGAQASLRELLKDASSIAELAESGLRTSIGQPSTASSARRSGSSTARDASSSSAASEFNFKKNSSSNNKDSNKDPSAAFKQFVHRIPVTTLSWATETTPNFKLPTPGKKSAEQIFAVGTALGHVYVCRWNMESSEIEELDEDEEDEDDDYYRRGGNDSSTGGSQDGRTDDETNSKSDAFSNTGSEAEDEEEHSDSDDDAEEDDGNKSVVSEQLAANKHLDNKSNASKSAAQTPATQNISHQKGGRSHSTIGQQQQHQTSASTISIDAIQQRLNDEANIKYKIKIPIKGKKAQQQQQAAAEAAAAALNNSNNNKQHNNNKTSAQRLVSSQSRLAASNKRMDRLRQRENDSTSANVAPVLALMPSPFDAPLVSMVNWNINHIDRPNLTKDEQAGANFGHGMNLSAAEKARMLEEVDSSASETMAKLRDAVGAEDRAAAREAQRRKTAGVGGDPQTNGGASIPGHSCGVSCTVLPGNHFLFSGDDRGVILMWDARSAFSQDAAIFRRPRKRFQFGHVDAITSLAATSDGLMCSASKDALVVVWSWIDGVKLHTLHHHHHVVTGLTLASYYEPYNNTSKTGDDDEDGTNNNHKTGGGDDRKSNANTAVSSRRHSAATSVFGGMSTYGGLGPEPSSMSAPSIFSTGLGSRSKSAKSSRHNDNRHKSRRSRSGGLQRRASSVVSQGRSANAMQSIKPWVGGVVVNNKRYNENPQRKSTLKTLLITSSLDETIQCFEICPRGTSSTSSNNNNYKKTNNNNNSKDGSSSSPDHQHLHVSNSGFATQQTNYLNSRRMSDVTGGGATPQLEGTSFAFSATTRSRTNSVAFDLM